MPQPETPSAHWLAAAALTACIGCKPTTADVQPARPTAPAPESESSDDDAPPPPPPSDAAPTCAAAPDWRPERIALPPAFAPSLPPGKELLWFAPGMFKRDAPDYFTYIFELDFEQPPPTDPEQLRTLLHAYYAGLMAAVGEAAKRTPGEVSVNMTATGPGHFEGRIEMTDEFTTGDALSVAVDLEIVGTCLVATVTPSGENAEALQQARSCLPCATR